MSDNMQDLLNNVQKMVDNGDIPDDLKNMVNNISPEMLNNFKNAFDSANSSNNTSHGNNFSNSDFSNNYSSNNNSSSNFSNNSSNSSNIPNIDMNTILKMKSVIDQMNQKDDPRANLLYSLKPYLRDSKKDKVDQYVNLLNMSKIADIMNSENKKEKNDNA